MGMATCTREAERRACAAGRSCPSRPVWWVVLGGVAGVGGNANGMLFGPNGERSVHHGNGLGPPPTHLTEGVGGGGGGGVGGGGDGGGGSSLQSAHNAMPSIGELAVVPPDQCRITFDDLVHQESNLKGNLVMRRSGKRI